MQLREAYRILGLDPGTETEQVTAHYRGLVKQMHPDAGGVVVDVGRIVEAYRTIVTGAEGGKPRSSYAFDKSVFSLGKLATSSGETGLRLQAVRQLARCRRYAGAVFMKQALFDADGDVAYAAAVGMVSIPGTQVERDLLSVYEQLTVPQRVGILREIDRQDRNMARFLAYAGADSHPEVRVLAREIAR